MDIHKVIKSQYHASLEMLAQTVEKCPPLLWNRDEDKNKFWQLAYHALFYTHLYLFPTEEDFVPWEKHHPEIHRFPKPSPNETQRFEPYKKGEILEYLEYLRGQLDELVDAVDLHAESGFDWLPFGKLELQFYNIRHLMQHTGELGERLGHAAQLDIDWVAMRRKE